MLSNTSKYAIRAVVYLALNIDEQKKTGLKKISKDLNIPLPFLGKILQVLVRKKILSSTKGPNGGFGLSKKPEEISLYEIITEMEGDNLFNTCLLGTGACSGHNSSKVCVLHDDFVEVRKQMILLYKKKTVAQVAQKVQNNINSIVL